LISQLKIDATKPVLIVGPTASGKSGLALKIAAEYGGVIVNGDALQVYGNWRLLTARPSAVEEAQAPHHLYGHIAKEIPYSVGLWLREVAPLLARKNGQMPIIVGGTGLFFSSLTNGLAAIPDVANDVRQAANEKFESGDIAILLSDLEKYDLRTFSRIDRQNPARIMRAWEVWKSTGRGLTDWHTDAQKPLLPLDQTNAFVLDAPKAWLTPRINQRFGQMLEQGALDECQDNLTGWDPARPSSRAIGAPELMAHLRGEMTLDAAIEAAEIATRQYAKRQRSWFRARMKDWTWINPSTDACG
jgi:tRNA dimethylallyltransferase